MQASPLLIAAEVMGTVRLVAPEKFTLPLDVKLLKVPTLVNEEFTTVELSVVPVSVPALAVTVMSPVPSNATPLIFRAVCSLVAVPALPVTDPLIGLVTVRLVSVPTLVKDEATTVAFRTVPVSVLESAVTVISLVPSKATPFMLRAVCSLVAVAALPVVEPEEPVTDPLIGLVTVKLARVPTLVREESVTVALSMVPVNVPASAVTVMLVVPSKLTPLIVRGFCKAVAVAAFPVVEPEDPVTEPTIGFVTVRLTRVPTLVSEEATTLELRVVPVSVPAAAVTVMSAVPSKETPLILRGV